MKNNNIQKCNFKFSIGIYNFIFLNSYIFMALRNYK